ncbi:SoxR reducing system RseC family protein [uncultured Thiocystis sp.]|jgi:sigma-E factor negative regulatory protein RseC|uniref:SoxR reducing system RseC family protein n=1 Tax=uncultured Thiocystis sp. TaxID=1202134 RepID=UPI0025F06ECD|nr:SoxR reducing system RseC family protein [uncultured Thiocystis sp.]
MSIDVPAPEDSTDPLQPELVEGLARVVAVEGRLAWLEPEQTTSCGGCAASGLCGAKGIGTTASRLEMRRFPLVNDAHLAVGERVVVGVDARALLKASGTAYALPLGIMLGAGGVAQWIAGSDGITMATMLAGLGVGLLAARWGARWLGARGQLAPRFLRRASAGETCRIE